MALDPSQSITVLDALPLLLVAAAWGRIEMRASTTLREVEKLEAENLRLWQALDANRKEAERKRAELWKSVNRISAATGGRGEQ